MRLKIDTIRARLLVSFVLIALLPVLAAAVGSAAVGIYNGRQQARERLESVAISKELAISQWVDKLRQELAVAATNAVPARLPVVVELASTRKYLDFYFKAVRYRLSEVVNRSTVLQEIFLVDSLGRVALSTAVEQEGQDVSNQDFFHAGLASSVAILPFRRPSESAWSDAVTIAMPIMDEGRSVGVLTARGRADSLSVLLQEPTGLGKTGKAYMVDRNHAVLGLDSASDRIEGNDAPGQQIAGPIVGIVDASPVGYTFYRDYRGIPVIAIYRWMPEFQATLVIEQDQAEAFRPIAVTLAVNLSVALAALVLAVGLSQVVRRGIANPIEDLADVASRVAKGDLNQVVPVTRDDEIGVLARAFNSMTVQLRDLINNLEQRVRERTEALQRLAIQLETSAQVSRQVTSILTIDSLLDRVTQLIAGSFGYYGVLVYLLDSEAKQLINRAHNRPVSLVERVIPISIESLNAEAVRTNEAVLVDDVTEEPRFLPDADYPDVRSELVIPLRVGSRVIGTLDLMSTTRNGFQTDDVLTAQSLADQIAIAIENARLYEQSRALAVLEERNRLAREFHDALNQSLYSMVLFSGAAQAEAARVGGSSLQHYLTRIESMAQQALKEMRLMIYEMRPKVLEDKGLVAALQQRLDAVEASAGLDVDLVATGSLDLPSPVEEALYRIVQESLNNTLKHASATSVRVTLCRQGDNIEVGIVDNGVGFDPTAMGTSAGLGLKNIRERASQLGADLRIESAPGAGTQVTLSLALRAERATGGQEVQP